MRNIYVDSLYWIAVTHRRDQWNQAALKASMSLINCHFFTTEEVLTEFLTAFCAAGPLLRQKASTYVHKLYIDQTTTIIPQTNQSFLAGLALYESRLDKGYSLTDCISMTAMRQQGITEVLTNDDHFAQEGFIKLM